MKFSKFATLVLSLIVFELLGQTITKTNNFTVPGALCPRVSTFYQVSRPSGFENCQVSWSATNGQVINQNGDFATVEWYDTPGAIGTVKATFSNCGNNNNGTEVSKSELILSINNLPWGAHVNTVNIDFCNTTFVDLVMPRMFVPGTGGVGQPPTVEAIYLWNIPAGWKDSQTGNSGLVETIVPSIRIVPTKCAIPTNVTVRGTLVGSSAFCNSAAPSQQAIISLNGISPLVTVVPPSGFYNEVTVCDRTPLTFSATTNVPFSCLNSFVWTFPAGWEQVSSTANTITLRPSGTGGGNILATANFTCGTQTASSQVSITLKQPIVLGPNLICTTGNFSVQDAPFATVTWSTNNTTVLTIDPVTGVATRVPKKRGSVTVSANFNCPVPPATKTTWVGEPLLSDENLYVAGAYGQNPVTLNPSAQYYFDITRLISTNPDVYQRVNVPGATSYTWFLPSGFSLFANYGSRAIIQTAAQNGTYLPYVAAVNECGSGGSRALTVIVAPGGGSGIILVTTPNPASDEIDVSLDKDVPFFFENTQYQSDDAAYLTAEKVYYSLFDQSGREVFSSVESGNKTRINVGNLNEGLYILKAKIGNRVFTQRVLIRR